jgi:FHA domain-containing protein
MSALTLQVVSIDAVATEQPIMRAFDLTGGSIGRDESNFLALPDKHRRVSRLHATISFPGGVPTITNSSTSLPLSVGEQQLDGGDSMPVAQGALIEIGPYILQASLGGANERIAFVAPIFAFHQDLTPTRLPDALAAPAPAPAPAAAPASNPFIPLSNGHITDPFVGDLSDILPPSPPATPRVAANAGLAPARAAPADDVDPFADLLAGIGGAPLPQPTIAVRNDFTPAPHAQHSPPSQPVQPNRVGVSADPMAAFGFGAAPSPDAFSSIAGAAPLDPFHMPTSATRNSADPLAGLLGGSLDNASHGGQASAAHVPSIDSLFLQSGGSGAFGGADSAHRSPFDLGDAAHRPDASINDLLRSDASSDPMVFFASDEASAAPSARPMRDDRIEVGSAFSPPLAVPTPHFGAASQASVGVIPADFANWGSPEASPSQPAPLIAPPVVAPPVFFAPPPAAAPGQKPLPSPQPALNTDALTDAFLRGAGLAPTALPNGLTPEIMTVIGSLLRSATAGAVDMLAARAATKREVQASVTIISVQANNPLKFLPNADSALLQLLGKKMPGFMRADVAMRDAFDDLRAHEVGVIAGTRAALTEVLGKFDPAILADKLTRGSMLESLIPSARKAKLWDLYLERYLQIRREAEDDFQSIFGRAFVQAYERETARIKGESPMSGGQS